MTLNKDAVKGFLDYLNSENEKSKSKNELFENESKKVSMQVCFHKIPNLLSEKRIICKLPHSLIENENQPEVCLIVKDVDKKDRDYEKTIRRYQELIEKNNLSSIIREIVPLKQLNLEFRHFEAKRKLSTSYDIFLADKCLHEILFSGSKLGREFRKRRKMPFEIDLEKTANLRENVMNILNSTCIRLNGKGTLVDINAFLSSHSVEQAMANLNEIKTTLVKYLPGGEQNIKSIFIKTTNSVAVPVYEDKSGTNINEIKLKNNMTPSKLAKSKKVNKVKRLKKKQLKEKLTKKQNAINKKSKETKTVVQNEIA